MGSLQIINAIKDANIEAAEVKETWNRFNPKQKYRLRKWQYELKNLCKLNGLTLEGLAQCIGAPVVKFPRFYTHLPKEKETYVLIAIALNQNFDTVNRWIIKNSKQQSLYAKIDIDLIGLYFLNLSAKGGYRGREHELCEMYSSCTDQLKSFKEQYGKEIRTDLNEIKRLLQNIDNLEHKLLTLGLVEIKKNDEISAEKYKLEEEIAYLKEKLKSFEAYYEKPIMTNDLEIKTEVEVQDHSDFLIQYIRKHQRSFQNAHENPRSFLNGYVDILLDSRNRTKRGHESAWSRATLKDRGNITDALYNYLTGEGTQKPKKKSTVISYCLQLGMGLEQTNETLNRYGYDQLTIHDDTDKFAEFCLIPLLICWEESNEDVKNWRMKYIYGENNDMTSLEEYTAVKKILSMRDELILEFNNAYKGEVFPF